MKALPFRRCFIVVGLCATHIGFAEARADSAPNDLAVTAPADAAPTVAKISLPHDLRQILVRDGSGFATVPIAQVAQTGATSTVIQVVNRADQLKDAPTLTQVRAAYGGIYPYIVVRSRYPYVVVSQQLDVLIVGVQAPEQVVVTPSPPLTLVPRPDGTLVAQPAATPAVQVVQVVNRIDPKTTLPPGVPADVLKKNDLGGLGSSREPTWEPNRRRAFEITSQHTVEDAAGTGYRVFQVEIR